MWPVAYGKRMRNEMRMQKASGRCRREGLLAPDAKIADLNAPLNHFLLTTPLSMENPILRHHSKQEQELYSAKE
jgi:hypothetical protein